MKTSQKGGKKVKVIKMKGGKDADKEHDETKCLRCHKKIDDCHCKKIKPLYITVGNRCHHCNDSKLILNTFPFQ